MITHDFKLLFIHIPKCAGRSVCDVFNQRFDHFTANYYMREYPHAWDNYSKFTIVRNPFERMVSLYNYIKEHRRHRFEEIAVHAEMPTFSQWLKINISAFQNDFDMNSPEGQRGTDGQLGSPFWFSSQKRRLITDGTLHESITVFKVDDGMHILEKWLSEKINIRFIMPHVNHSEVTNWRSYYTDDARQLAESFQPFIEDCELFNYKF